jgi:ABC-type nickel/cobalt efflux system permease component RcnA
MALVIFASSFLGVSLNKASSKSKKLVNILEIASVIFMFILALFMLMASLNWYKI